MELYKRVSRGGELKENQQENRLNCTRRLYEWVMGWSETRYGTPALAIFSFSESSFFPIPPDPLLLCLCMGEKSRPMRLAAVCTFASVSGGILGYLIGAAFWEISGNFFFNYVPGFTLEKFSEVGVLYKSWGFVAIFAASFTPMPYKVFTISAGVFGINFLFFFLASLLGRGLRFFILAGMISFFGPSMKDLIDRYFNWLVWLLMVLLIAGFWTITRFP